MATAGTYTTVGATVGVSDAQRASRRGRSLQDRTWTPRDLRSLLAGLGHPDGLRLRTSFPLRPILSTHDIQVRRFKAAKALRIDDPPPVPCGRRRYSSASCLLALGGWRS